LARKRALIRWTALTAIALFLAGAAAATDGAADMILTGGRVYTPDGWKQAVAIRDGTIIAVGTDAEVARERGPDTHTLDLAGAPLFPGLRDEHIHPVSAALERLACRVPPGASWDDVLNVVRACAEAPLSGGWIIATPVESEALMDPRATRQALDAAAPGKSVLILAVGGHAAVANTQALAAAGIDGSTPVPPGSVIARDSSGDLTGLLQEAPINLVVAALPPPDPAVIAMALAGVLDELLAAGVTSVTDANSNVLNLQAYSGLADAGRLVLRVRSCSMWALPAPVESATDVGRYSRDRLATDCVKIFVDGESYTGRTAALLEPYQPADGSVTDELGALAVPPDALSDAVIAFDRAGLTVKFHAWGDAAVNAALTAIEAAREANGSTGPRHQIGHVMLARREDIDRARRTNAVLEFSPAGWQPPALPLVGKDIGALRMARAWPVRDALEAGAPAVAGTDWPAGPPGPYNPWMGIETLVTRLNPGDTQGEPLAPGQRVSLEQAIAMFTEYPATHSSEPDSPVIIAPGREADLIVLDRNPFEVPITDVHRIKTLRTIVGGEIVWEADGS